MELKCPNIIRCVGKPNGGFREYFRENEAMETLGYNNLRCHDFLNEAEIIGAGAENIGVQLLGKVRDIVTLLHGKVGDQTDLPLYRYLQSVLRQLRQLVSKDSGISE